MLYASGVGGRKPWYVRFFGGEACPTMLSPGLWTESVSGLEAVDDVLERGPILTVFQGEEPRPMGEGRGVMSVMAASCGDENADPGDSDPAAECVDARAALILGVRRGRLAVEELCRRG